MAGFLKKKSREDYIQVANSLSIMERDYLRLMVEGKSCNNCSNGSCRVESSEKSCFDACIA